MSTTRIDAAQSREGITKDSFDWPLANESERLLRTWTGMFLEKNTYAARLSDAMRDQTGTDFFEWIDHLMVARSLEPQLIDTGFVLDGKTFGPDGERVYECPRATLPRVLVRESAADREQGLALRPERVADFVARNNLGVKPIGDPFGRYRCATVAEERGAVLNVVERRGYRGFTPQRLGGEDLKAVICAREFLRTRPRKFLDAAAGFEMAEERLAEVLKLVDRDLACDLFFEGERAYWESRNRAARLQKHRQDLLGLGWGNHDHHTFRCSRAHFVDLVSFLLRLGFEKRERFYAGAEAGWGAQVLEHPIAAIVVFADVDLLPEETQFDFSTQRSGAVSHLGTVGLWVGLHGESFLDAGMHHLEARFDFERLREQLRGRGIGMMKPFSEFEFLKQAFTEGEWWQVVPERARRLLQAGLISNQQCEEFIEKGAVGSHLENLQRHGGFKGFNQQSVSVVIVATDPRLQKAVSGAAAVA